MSTEAPVHPTPQPPSEPSEQVAYMPEWDNNAKVGATATASRTRNCSSGKAVLQEKFNAVLPRSRSYFGLKRRTFLIVLACGLLALLALIIGLAVGLTKHSNR